MQPYEQNYQDLKQEAVPAQFPGRRRRRRRDFDSPDARFLLPFLFSPFHSPYYYQPYPYYYPPYPPYYPYNYGYGGGYRPIFGENGYGEDPEEA